MSTEQLAPCLARGRLSQVSVIAKRGSTYLQLYHRTGRGRIVNLRQSGLHGQTCLKTTANILTIILNLKNIVLYDGGGVGLLFLFLLVCFLCRMSHEHAAMC